MWDQIFKRWIDLAFWWLPRPAAEQSAPQAAEPAAAPPEAVEPAAPSTPEPVAQAHAPSDPGPDDLTVIKGIGPAVQQKLQALGIRTFNDLAAADPETLAEQLKGRQPISQALVRGWTEAADQRTAARH